MRHAAIGLALVWTAPALAQPADGIEVRFCPENVAHPYPLDSLRGVQGLLLQNIAILNRGAAAAEVTSVEIVLLRGGEVQDSRRIAGPGLEAAARTGHGLQAQGMVQALGFQFCGDRLLGAAQLSERPTLAGGDALLLMQQVFAWRGTRDEARVTVTASLAGRPTTVTASLRLDPATSRTTLRWPLAGGPWLVGAGAASIRPIAGPSRKSSRSISSRSTATAARIAATAAATNSSSLMAPTCSPSPTAGSPA